MTKKTYAELLQLPEWQKRRLEIMQRDGFACKNCGSAKTNLHVHHRLYLRGATPWQYVDNALVTLCEDCHARWHELQSRIDALLCQLTATQFLDIRTDATLSELGEYLRSIAHAKEKETKWAEGYAEGFAKAEESWRKSLSGLETKENDNAK